MMITVGKNKTTGFTLLELVVVLGIMSIVALMAAPSFLASLQKERLVKHANELSSVFRLARSEAVKRENTVELTVNDGNWVVSAIHNGQDEVINEFRIEDPALNIALVERTISPTGEINLASNILIHNKQNDTYDLRLCILQSGQSWLTKAKNQCV
jgi:type IV fimbrial biogenesis protein FimT